MGAKVDWDFRISDLVKNPDRTDVLTSVANFGEIRRTQLAKSTLLTSSLVPLGSLKICSDAKERERERERERVGYGKQRVATAPIHRYTGCNRTSPTK